MTENQPPKQQQEKEENHLIIFLVGIILFVGAFVSVFFIFNNPEEKSEENSSLELVGRENESENLQKLKNEQNNQSQKSQTTQTQPIKEKGDKMTNNLNQPMQIDANKIYIANLKTTQGNIVIEFNAKAMPITVNNFVSLAKNDFYNNTIFHRVIKGFMIQGGDPKGDGTGGPGYSFEDEAFEGDYTRGTVAMANSGPNTNGSQFFIMHKDYNLPKNYVIFGKVTGGMDTVDKIAEAEVTLSSSGEESKPVNPAAIESIEITEK